MPRTPIAADVADEVKDVEGGIDASFLPPG